MDEKKKKIVKGACIAVAAVLLVFAALLATGGVFAKKYYISPWSESYYKSFDDRREQLVAHGVLAASAHNTQPWEVRLDTEDKNVFYLYARTERMLPYTDPFARELMISQGTFLEYIRVAGNSLGIDVDIELMPDGEFEENKLAESLTKKAVAKITLSQKDAVESPLYSCMFLPDTNRSGYEKNSVSASAAERLEGLSADGITVKVFYSTEAVTKLNEFALSATKIVAKNKKTSFETGSLLRKNEYQKNSYRFGMSLDMQTNKGLKLLLEQGGMTIMPFLTKGIFAQTKTIDEVKKATEKTFAYLLISSAGSSRAEQIKCGMMYSRAVLTAHTENLAMQPISAPLQELADLKEINAAVNAAFGDGQTISMVVRLGKPTKETPVTMREDVDEVLKPQ